MQEDDEYAVCEDNLCPVKMELQRARDEARRRRDFTKNKPGPSQDIFHDVCEARNEPSALRTIKSQAIRPANEGLVEMIQVSSMQGFKAALDHIREGVDALNAMMNRARSGGGKGNDTLASPYRSVEDVPSGSRKPEKQIGNESYYDQQEETFGRVGNSGSRPMYIPQQPTPAYRPPAKNVATSSGKCQKPLPGTGLNDSISAKDVSYSSTDDDMDIQKNVFQKALATKRSIGIKSIPGQSPKYDCKITSEAEKSSSCCCKQKKMATKNKCRHVASTTASVKPQETDYLLKMPLIVNITVMQGDDRSPTRVKADVQSEPNDPTSRPGDENNKQQQQLPRQNERSSKMEDVSTTNNLDYNKPSRTSKGLSETTEYTVSQEGFSKIFSEVVEESQYLNNVVYQSSAQIRDKKLISYSPEISDDDCVYTAPPVIIEARACPDICVPTSGKIPKGFHSPAERDNLILNVCAPTTCKELANLQSAEKDSLSISSIESKIRELEEKFTNNSDISDSDDDLDVCVEAKDAMEDNEDKYAGENKDDYYNDRDRDEGVGGRDGDDYRGDGDDYGGTGENNPGDGGDYTARDGSSGPEGGGGGGSDDGGGGGGRGSGAGGRGSGGPGGGGGGGPPDGGGPGGSCDRGSGKKSKGEKKEIKILISPSECECLENVVMRALEMFKDGGQLKLSTGPSLTIVKSKEIEDADGQPVPIEGAEVIEEVVEVAEEVVEKVEEVITTESVVIQSASATAVATKTTHSKSSSKPSSKTGCEPTPPCHSKKEVSTDVVEKFCRELCKMIQDSMAKAKGRSQESCSCMKQSKRQNRFSGGADNFVNGDDNRFAAGADDFFGGGFSGGGARDGAKPCKCKKGKNKQPCGILAREPPDPKKKMCDFMCTVYKDVKTAQEAFKQINEDPQKNACNQPSAGHTKCRTGPLRCERNNSDPCEYPVTIKSVSPIGDQTLLVKWDVKCYVGIGGYKIFVDNCVKTRLPSSRHNSACVYGVDVARKHWITLYAVADKNAFKVDLDKCGENRDNRECTLDKIVTYLENLMDVSALPSTRPPLPSSWTPSTFCYDPRLQKSGCP